MVVASPSSRKAADRLDVADRRSLAGNDGGRLNAVDGDLRSRDLFTVRSFKPLCQRQWSALVHAAGRQRRLCST